jgi:hypothetical protein
VISAETTTFAKAAIPIPESGMVFELSNSGAGDVHCFSRS